MYKKILTLCLVPCILFSMDQSSLNERVEVLSDIQNNSMGIVSGSVNVMNGHYFVTETDLNIPGPNPILFQRTYNSGNYGLGRFCRSWDDNHTFTAHFFGDEKHSWVSLREGSGALQYKGKYSKKTKQDLRYDKDHIQWGICNGTGGSLSGSQNLFNRKVKAIGGYNREIEVVHENNDKLIFYNSSLSTYNLVNREKLNGCHIDYFWASSNRLNKVRYLDQKIKTIGHIEWTKNNSSIALTAHDNRKVNFLLKDTITKVERPNLPTVYYDWESIKPFECQFLTKRYFDNQRFTQIKYYQKGKQDVGDRMIKVKDGTSSLLGRVASLSSPVGTDATPILTHRFYYHLDSSKKSSKPIGGTCEVLDALNNKQVYSFSNELRMKSLSENSENNQLYRIHKLYWGEKGTPFHTFLLAKSLGSNEKEIHSCQLFSYDDQGNMLTETVAGNLSGKSTEFPKLSTLGIQRNPNCEQSTVRYSYNQDNLVIKKEDDRQSIAINYESNSSRVASKIISDSSEVRERAFYSYDDNSAVIEEINDDGNGEDRSDLSNVSQRMITRTERTAKSPVGLPKIITEYYLDLQTGAELQIRKTCHTYTLEGFVTKTEVYDSQDTLAYLQEWKYDRFGNVIWEKDPLGYEITYKYDSNGNCTRKQTPLLTIESKYDYTNRLISETFQGTYKKSYSYDYNSNLISSTDIYDNTTHYSYDHCNRLTTKTFPLIPNENGEFQTAVERIQYDLSDQPAVKINANGEATRYEYTPRGDSYLIEYPDGSQEQFVYHLDGTLFQSIDPNGVVTEYDYDYKKRKIREEKYSPNGSHLSTKSWIYNAQNLLCEIDPEGIQTEYTYDGAGRLTTVKRGDTETRYGYDSLGRQTEVWEKWAEGRYHITIQTLDTVDRVVEERVEDQEGNLLSRTTWSYDFDGNITSKTIHTDSGLSTTRKQYNHLGEVTKIIDPDEEETNFVYQYDSAQTCIEVDPNGFQIVRTHNAQSQVETEEYLDSFGKILHKAVFINDGTGNLLLRTDHIYSGDQQERITQTTFEYDARGRQITIIEAKGEPEQKITRKEYTFTGQVASIQKPDGVIITRHYDDLDRLTTLCSSDETIHYSYLYDLNDNIIATCDHNQDYSLSRIYDDNNRLLEENFNNEHTLNYQYDQRGRQTCLTLPDQTTIDYTYDASHLKAVSRKEYTHHYVYDLSGRMSRSGDTVYTYDRCLRPIQQDGSQLKQELQYDPVGNLISLIQTDPMGITHCQYTYDPLYQLKSETGFTTNSYQSDSLNNLLQKNEECYTVNALNQLTQRDEQTYNYDLNGNLVTSDQEFENIYDALDRLIEVNTPSCKITYQYDPFHRRLNKKQFILSKDQWVMDRVENYLYQKEIEIGVLENSVVTELRVIGQGLCDEVGSAVLFELHGKTYIPQHDIRGNVALIAESKTLEAIQTYHYSAYGEELFQDALIPWRFSSKRVDPETGWIYFGRRYYEPQTGRWTTADPAWFADGPNLYCYVHNNPLRYCDPDGLSAMDFMRGATKTFGQTLAMGAAMQASVVAAGTFCPVLGAGLAVGYTGYAVGSLIYDNYDTISSTYTTFSEEGFSGGVSDIKSQVSQKLTELSEASDYEKGEMLGLGASLLVPGAKSTKTVPSGKVLRTHMKESGINKVGSVDRSTSFFGSRSFQLDYAPYQKVRNEPAVIHGRSYQGHALDRMQDRGYLPSVVENVIVVGKRTSNKVPGRVQYYDSVNRVRVITESCGEVVTIIPGRR